jgi:GTPase SAR1 family protein
MLSDTSLEIDTKEVAVAVAVAVKEIKILVVGDSGVGKTTLIHEACFGKI